MTQFFDTLNTREETSRRKGVDVCGLVISEVRNFLCEILDSLSTPQLNQQSRKRDIIGASKHGPADLRPVVYCGRCMGPFFFRPPHFSIFFWWIGILWSHGYGSTLKITRVIPATSDKFKGLHLCSKYIYLLHNMNHPNEKTIKNLFVNSFKLSKVVLSDFFKKLYPI